ncbi:MAG: response regulator [Gammaproteobacteria bacterium]|nr:response regulator [Gammaproteobacteria bacterium]
MNETGEQVIADSVELEQRVSFEAICDIYQLVVGRIMSMSTIVLIVIAVMWSQIAHDVLIIWGLLIISGIVLQDYNARLFIRQNARPIDFKKWNIRLISASLYFGLLWASSVFLFHTPKSIEHQIFLSTVILSLGLVKIVASLYYLPLFYVYAAPMIIALAIRFAMEGTLAYAALAILMVWLLLGSISFAKILNKSMRSEKRLRHESHALVDALQVKSEEAQQATMAKSRFLAAASHDLRQPLHALSLFVDVLKDSNSDKERACIFPRLELSVDALRKLFDALLDVSRLDAKVVKPEYSHFDLAELLQDMAVEFKTAANKKNLRLKVYARSAIIVSDQLLLERILRNLITNAIRYTESGGILLSARMRGDTVLMQVWDTGIGIAQKSRKEIFVEFQQLHNAHRDRSQGLGLGLALVKRLCDLLHYPLTLRSQPGKGSIFSITIPRGNAGLIASKQAAKTHSWNLNGRHVLVIDDEHEILHAMKTLLSKWGCEAVTADSLEDAINQLNEKEFVPELVLSDLRLRNNETGIEAIDGVREIFGSSIPGVLITGDTDPESLKIARQSDYELLQKPIRPAHLRTVIHHKLSVIE